MFTMRIVLCAAGLFLLAAVSASEPTTGTSSPAATTDSQSGGSVWCHDEKLSTVRRRARWRCKGKIVSQEEAQRIKQERIERIKRVLQRESNPILPGKRLIGTGTGFFVSVAGQVLTNHHVVKGCNAITVTPAGGSEIVATLRGNDPRRDLALLETSAAWPAAAVFRSVGETISGGPVTLVGYPLHGKVVIKPILVSGRVQAGAQPRNPHVFAMRIDVRRGNSGGPVLDETARVMGVVFAKVDTPAVYEKTGTLIRDVGLGIRLHIVRDFLRRHSVDVVTLDAAPKLRQEELLARAREFIAQIGCWR